MQRSAASLPCPVGSTRAGGAIDPSAALVPVSARVADLLAPTRTTPRYRDNEFDGVSELWEPKAVSQTDVPDLRRQLEMIEVAMQPGEPGAVLGRIHALLAHYRGAELPEAVERAIAADWLDDIAEFPASVVAEACRRHRRGPKMRFRPLPGEIRESCIEILGRLPVVAGRLRKLIASVPKSGELESTGSRAADVRSRVVALAMARKMS